MLLDPLENPPCLELLFWNEELGGDPLLVGQHVTEQLPRGSSRLQHVASTHFAR